MTRRIFLPVLLAPLLLHAGDSARDRATLKGVTSIAVVVDVLPDDFEKEGIIASALRDRLIGRLLDAGIPLDESSKDFLGLRASSVRDKRGPYAVSLSLGFYQPATLVRDPTARIAPQTWDTGIVLMAVPKVLTHATMESIDDLAGRFIEAWRSVHEAPAK